MKITQAQGNGQGQCALCKKRGKWNVQWMCFLYEVEGKDGVYCKHCVDELKMQDYVAKRKAGTPIEDYTPLYNCENWIP